MKTIVDKLFIAKQENFFKDEGNILFSEHTKCRTQTSEIEAPMSSWVLYYWSQKLVFKK